MKMSVTPQKETPISSSTGAPVPVVLPLTESMGTLTTNAPQRFTGPQFMQHVQQIQGPAAAMSITTSQAGFLQTGQTAQIPAQGPVILSKHAPVFDTTLHSTRYQHGEDMDTQVESDITPEFKGDPMTAQGSARVQDYAKLVHFQQRAAKMAGKVDPFMVDRTLDSMLRQTEMVKGKITLIRANEIIKKLLVDRQFVSVRVLVLELPRALRSTVATSFSWECVDNHIIVPSDEELIRQVNDMEVPMEQELVYVMTEEQKSGLVKEWNTQARARNNIWFGQFRHFFTRIAPVTLINDICRLLICDPDLQLLYKWVPAVFLNGILPSTHPNYTMSRSFVLYSGQDARGEEPTERDPVGNSIKGLKIGYDKNAHHLAKWHDSDTEFMRRYGKCITGVQVDTNVMVINVCRDYVLCKIPDKVHNHLCMIRQNMYYTPMSNFCILVLNAQRFNHPDIDALQGPFCFLTAKGWVPPPANVVTSAGCDIELDMDKRTTSIFQCHQTLKVRLNAFGHMDAGKYTHIGYPRTLSPLYRVSSYISVVQIIKSPCPQVHVGIVSHVKETAPLYPHDQRFMPIIDAQCPAEKLRWIVKLGGENGIADSVMVNPIHFNRPEAMLNDDESGRGAMVVIKLTPGQKLKLENPDGGRSEEVTIPPRCMEVITRPESHEFIQMYLAPHYFDAD